MIPRWTLVGRLVRDDSLTRMEVVLSMKGPVAKSVQGASSKPPSETPALWFPASLMDPKRASLVKPVAPHSRLRTRLRESE